VATNSQSVTRFDCCAAARLLNKHNIQEYWWIQEVTGEVCIGLEQNVIEIAKVTRLNFTGLVLLNAGRIAVDKIFVWFRISSSVPEIFAAELRSHPKRAKFCMFLAPKIFFGKAPEILDRHYKIGPSRQNFTPVSPRISEISRWKKNITAIASGRFKNW